MANTTFFSHLLAGIRQNFAVLGWRTMALWATDDFSRWFTGASRRRLSQVTPLVHVGGQHFRHGLRRFAARGIGAVVNLRAESDDTGSRIASLHYLFLPVIDNHGPTLAQLKEGVAFISAQVAQGVGVYVHCNAGAGRSPSLVAAYLVSRGMGTHEAWHCISRIRPFVIPSREQLESVEGFQRALRREPVS